MNRMPLINDLWRRREFLRLIGAAAALGPARPTFAANVRRLTARPGTARHAPWAPSNCSFQVQGFDRDADLAQEGVLARFGHTSFTTREMRLSLKRRCDSKRRSMGGIVRMD